jgi:hypothetical protein
MLRGSKCKRIITLGIVDRVTTNPTTSSKETSVFVEDK